MTDTALVSQRKLQHSHIQQWIKQHSGALTYFHLLQHGCHLHRATDEIQFTGEASQKGWQGQAKVFRQRRGNMPQRHHVVESTVRAQIRLTAPDMDKTLQFSTPVLQGLEHV